MQNNNGINGIGHKIFNKFSYLDRKQLSYIEYPDSISMIDKYSRVLNKRREVWKSKEILRRLSHKWYGIIGDAIKPGSTMEIGGGSGNFKEFSPDVISYDIIFIPCLDVVVDAAPSTL
ncbi:MAG: hypothetical protein KAT52_05550 [Desulfobacterales bacterium]|nr:hypothetical protein [Desulfobacterales bacterium]